MYPRAKLSINLPHHHIFNVHISMLSKGWTFLPKFGSFGAYLLWPDAFPSANHTYSRTNEGLNVSDIHSLHPTHHSTTVDNSMTSQSAGVI